MKNKTIVAVVNPTVAVEITQEELDLLIRKREEDIRKELKQGYIDEMNDLLARAKEDGFRFLYGHTIFRYAENTENLGGNYISFN